MKIALFIGAGVSYGCGLPTIQNITQSILNDQWHSHTDQLFYSGPQQNEYFQKENLVLRLQPFLEILQSFNTQKNRTGTNYEDLFYLAQQIFAHEYGEMENTAIIPFINYLKKKTKELTKPLPGHRKKLSLGLLADKSCDFIQNVVWNKLFTKSVPINLEILNDLAHLDDLERIDIYTLNHDLLIENLFSSIVVKYIDGFGKAEGDVRYFDPALFEKDSKIYFYKIHGSINWFRFRKDKDPYYDRYGIPLKPDAWHCKDEIGNFLINLDGKPSFLTGTYNKLIDYGFGIFSEMFLRFNTTIQNHNLLIMSGYGWNDRGINARLMEWIYSSLDKRFVLLHEKPEVIRDTSKSSMWHRYDDLVKEGRLVIIKKWLSDIQMQDLLPFLK